MPSSLWTPDGEVPTAERGVVPITREEVIVLSKLQEIAHRLGLVVFCKACEKNVSGQNNDSSKVLSVSCQCREFRYDGR